jgi:hypothetical protein
MSGFRRGGNIDRAHDPVARIIKLNDTSEFIGQAALQHARPEPLSDGRSDRRPTNFLPAQHDPPGGFAVRGYKRPCHPDAARVVGKRAIFDGVRRQFVDRDTDRQRRLRRETNILPRDGETLGPIIATPNGSSAARMTSARPALCQLSRVSRSCERDKDDSRDSTA